MQYVVLDLEMCQVNGCDKKRYSRKYEIIQLGAVKVNDRYQIIDEFNTYVKPEYGKINRFIQNLTGIYNTSVKDADTLATVLQQFVSWIGTEPTTFVAWSDSDYKQLSKEIQAKKISADHLTNILAEENWLDYQSSFSARYEFRHRIKLSDALDLAAIDLEGRCHDGLCDAYNTARLFTRLETDLEYKLTVQKIEEYINPEPMGFTLGELFGGQFSLQLA